MLEELCLVPIKINKTLGSRLNAIDFLTRSFLLFFFFKAVCNRATTTLPLCCGGQAAKGKHTCTVRGKNLVDSIIFWNHILESQYWNLIFGILFLEFLFIFSFDAVFNVLLCCQLPPVEIKPRLGPRNTNCCRVCRWKTTTISNRYGWTLFVKETVVC